MKWITFNPSAGSAQELPPERWHVLVQVAPRGSLRASVAVGYLRYAAGDKSCPQFIVPGVGGEVVAWSDCLPFDFHAPLWKLPHKRDLFERSKANTQGGVH